MCNFYELLKHLFGPQVNILLNLKEIYYGLMCGYKASLLGSVLMSIRVQTELDICSIKPLILCTRFLSAVMCFDTPAGMCTISSTLTY